MPGPAVAWAFPSAFAAIPGSRFDYLSPVVYDAMYTPRILHSVWSNRSSISAVVSGQILAAAGSFVGMRLLTEYLSPTVFGEYKLLMAALSLLYGILIRPVLQYLMRVCHEGDRYYGQFTFNRNARRFFLSWLVPIILASYAVGLLVGEEVPHYWHCLLILAGIFFLQSMLECEKSIAVSRNRQVLASCIGSASSWLIPLGIVSVSFVSLDIFGVLYGHILALLCIYALLAYFLRIQPLQPANIVESSIGITTLKPALSYSWPLALVGLFSWLVHESDRLFLGAMQGEHAIGIYSAAYGLIASPFTLVAGMAAQFLYSRVFSASANHDQRRETYVLGSMLLVSSVISCLGVLIIWAFSAQIASIVLGAEFREEAVRLFVWLAIAYGFQSVAMSFDLFAYRAKKTTHIMVAYLASATVNIVLNICLIPIYSALGAAMSTMFSLLCYLLVIAGLYFRDNGLLGAVRRIASSSSR